MAKRNGKNAGRRFSPPWHWLIAAAVGLLLGLYIGLGLAKFADGGEALFFLAWMVLCLYAAFLLQVLVHEAGHLVCGLLTGYSFVSFRIGSWMLVKREGKLHRSRFTLKGTGGQCLLAPPDGQDGHFPHLLYNLGGCLANGLLSILATLLYILWSGIPLLSPFFFITALTGAAYALLNGIPMRVGPVDNDGRNALQAIRSEAAAQGLWNQLKINSLTAAGVRLKDMPETYFPLPAGKERESSLCAAVGAFACCRAMDRHDFAQAAEIADELLENAPGLIGLHRQALTLERLFCELVGDHRREIIQELDSREFRQYCKAAASNPAVRRFWYAYELLGRGDETAAQAQREAFEKAAAAYPYTAEMEGERELLDCAQAAYRQQREALPTEGET